MIDKVSTPHKFNSLYTAKASKTLHKKKILNKEKQANQETTINYNKIRKILVGNSKILASAMSSKFRTQNRLTY